LQLAPGPNEAGQLFVWEKSALVETLLMAMGVLWWFVMTALWASLVVPTATVPKRSLAGENVTGVTLVPDRLTCAGSVRTEA
jgi:hypothetical protein